MSWKNKKNFKFVYLFEHFLSQFWNMRTVWQSIEIWFYERGRKLFCSDFGLNKSCELLISAIAFVWPANQSRDANILSRPTENTTKISPWTACNQSTNNASEILLVVVCSAMSNFNERQAIRESWASDQLEYVKVIFLLGKVFNSVSI